MPETVRMGSQGPTVRRLQTQLNIRMPAATSLLNIDGIFGPLTRGRTVDFQRSQALSPDGVVGPLTWAKLGEIPSKPPKNCKPSCSNGNPANKGVAQRVAFGLANAAGSGGGASLFSLVSAPASAPAASTDLTLPGGIVLRPLLGSSQEAIARSVYGGSLSYDRIFMSNKTGAQDRPFTIAMQPNPAVALILGLPVGIWIQVINLGTFTPSRSTLIHELAHVWQSQHHSSPTQFMVNCLACQGRAVATNGAIAIFDSSVRSDGDFPAHYPYSAYAYVPGLPFAQYGGEQIAQSVEYGEAAIVSHVAGVAALAVDPDNVSSLGDLNIKIADRRTSGVKF